MVLAAYLACGFSGGIGVVLNCPSIVSRLMAMTDRDRDPDWD